MWQAYLSGALGFVRCPMCDVDGPDMMDAFRPMSAACRRCHYAIEDLLNPDVFECLDSDDPRSTDCFTLERGGYNFEQDIWGIVKDGAAIDLSLSGVQASPPPPP